MSDSPTTDSPPASVLRLQRSFAASPEGVFDAWTSPEVLRRWWAAGSDWDCPSAEVDLSVGGRYRLAMHDPGSGDVHTIGGEYREIERPSRLVYTWRWELADAPESLVTVEFVSDGERTNVVLVHEGLDSVESRARHEHGWSACLDKLGERVLLG